MIDALPLDGFAMAERIAAAAELRRWTAGVTSTTAAPMTEADWLRGTAEREARETAHAIGATAQRDAHDRRRTATRSERTA